MRRPDLVEELILVASARNLAMKDNARAANDRKPFPYTAVEIRELRLQVHKAAARARAAGCDLNNIVGCDVGVGDFAG